jgi:ribonucleoside-diphosphate reductase alpha chain
MQSKPEAMRDRTWERQPWVRQDPSRNDLLSQFAKETLDRSYKLPGETYQDVFARVASYYADDQAHAQRLYDYMSQQDFMPATPVLSNGGTTRGLPISCFLNGVGDSITDILDNVVENAWLASKGGGIGTYWGDVRSIGEQVGHNGQTTGIIPFVKVQDSMTLAISQGSLRRGSAAIYLPIWHPEIEEFLEVRRPTGGDPNRKALNLHNAVVIDDAFMLAVEGDCDYQLRSPKTNLPLRTVRARDIWAKVLQLRMETGEPYILFIDTVNRAIPEHHKQLGLLVKQSNLCIEITLPTGLDHLGKMRTAVCCLSSLNLENFDRWKHYATPMIEDVLRMLDNVLQDFIEHAPPSMVNAVYSATRERSVGLGVMGWHGYLQGRGIAFESKEAAAINRNIFSTIKHIGDAMNVKLAVERGACPDAAEVGIAKRFSNWSAHAPTASISIIAGATPSTEPARDNAFLQKTLSGSFIVRNKHLEAWLEKEGMNDPALWQDIVAHKGSIQHLVEIPAEIREVFKTATEINPMAMIDQAADRTPFVCQSQSLNVFLPADSHKKVIHEVHYQAWKKGVKSLYYCRSTSVQAAEAVNKKVAQKSEAMPVDDDESKYETCAACQ